MGTVEPVIEAGRFCAELERRGVEFFTGVPCSFLQGPLAHLEARHSYVPAPNEGIALSLAAGAEMAGRRAAVLLQNSGVGNLLDPLTSLAMAYEIPLLLFVSLRGWPRAEDDEPHHAIMGRSTIGVLDAIGLAHGTLAPTEHSLIELLDRADHERGERRSFVILVPKGAVGGSDCRPETPVAVLGRKEAIYALIPHLADSLVYSTTGMISRELFAAADSARSFYMQGSMGHAIGLALGTALARPSVAVAAIDGDGAALMHLGALALVGDRRPANLTHVIVDNGAYDSTGGQRSRQASMRWTQLALALGYRTASTCHTVGDIDSHFTSIAEAPGPHLIAVRIKAGGPIPPRVTARYSNPQIRARFQHAVSGGAPLGRVPMGPHR